jgi:hypothetical protein
VVFELIVSFDATIDGATAVINLEAGGHDGLGLNNDIRQ